ncbi:MetQ/NlpA family ABC transporter substrate-binding protein [Gryllotalpicola koreensis]|uniref:MetQ/NlpA family ABC transporter substrate-binding protein n=1 Tax=Gryllotalpicola koreensis TaxID=993086 RepID=A0ABP8ACD3_9MICO
MSEPSLPPRLPEKPTRRTGLITGIVIAAVVVIVAVVLIVVNVAKPKADDAASGGASGAAASKPQTVSIGVTDASQPYWKIYSDLAKKKYNVTVKLVNFSDYSQPNPALRQKQLDLNEFQHIEYLADYNNTSGDDLQPIGPTAIYPLPLYSTKYKTPSELPADAPVAIPNDAINEARGLLVLQSAGLLELKDGGSPFSTVNDITSSKIKVTALDAAQTARALQSGSVEAAIVNKNYATDAKLPNTDIIAKDDPSDPSAQPYVNVFVARAADKDNKLYQELAALYLDPSVEKSVQDVNGGSAVFSDLSAKELQTLLAKTQEQEKAAKG